MGARRLLGRTVCAALGGVALGVVSAAALEPCDPNVLCAPAANPCAIVVDADFAAGCHLDFGTRAVVLTQTLTAAPAGAGFSISAGSLVLQGGQIRVDGPAGSDGGTLSIAVTGLFRMEGSGARVDVNGGTGGGYGGDMTIEAGSVEIAVGSITADGSGAGGSGGSIDVSASGPLSVHAPVRASAGSADGDGGIVLLAGTDVTITRGPEVIGGGYGGTISIAALGTLTITASASRLNARGTSYDEFGTAGGDGGEILIAAGGDATIDAILDVRGSTPDGDAGSIAVDAGGTLALGADVDAFGPAAGTLGGDVELSAGDDLTLAGIVNASGGVAREGGAIRLAAGGATSLAAGARLLADGGSAGGRVAAVGGGPLALDGVIEARGLSGTLAAPGGTIALGPFCSIAIGGTAKVMGAGAGDAGSIGLLAETVVLGATASLTAAPCASPPACGVTIGVRSGAPTIPPSAQVSPPPVTSVHGLAYCCGNGTVDGSEQCDDGNAAWCDGCTPACVAEPSPRCPDDGNACTVETCTPSGGCVSSPLVCDDGIACTADACDVLLGCVVTPDAAACSDGDPCTADVCDPESGCTWPVLPDASPCDDGNLCTTEDRCFARTCLGTGVPLACDDANPCTQDLCLPAAGCVSVESATLCPGCSVDGTPRPAGSPCTDANPCTRGETCNGSGACVGGAPLACDDGNPCTADTCVLGLCLHADGGCVGDCSGRPNGVPCSDGDACTAGACQGGQCASPVGCDDGNGCDGREVCAPGIGCRPSAPLPGCGQCASAAACDDQNPCTDDSCTPQSACSFFPNTAACSDGNACTGADTCALATCRAGPPVVCDDGQFCNGAESCHPATGCVGGAPPPLDDGVACTSDTCDEGADAVVHQPVHSACDDGNQCTDDVCDAADGCQSGPTASTCDDGVVCTADACDPLLGCVHVAAGCPDADADGEPDFRDACVVLAGSDPPAVPPDQRPSKLRLSLKAPAAGGGEVMVARGFFNPASEVPPIDPATYGVRVLVADEAGAVYDVAVPGDGVAPCGVRDGWSVTVAPARTVWWYRNESGALPPSCVAGSAKGLARVQIQDRTASPTAAFQFKVRMKGAPLAARPTLPIERVQVAVVLGAPLAGGLAGPQALGGQCTEFVLTGSPVPSASPKPFCKARASAGAVEKLTCKGP